MAMIPDPRRINCPITKESHPKEYHEAIMIMVDGLLQIYTKEGYSSLKRILLTTQLRPIIDIIDDGTFSDQELIETAVKNSLIDRYNESAEFLGKSTLECER